MNSKQSPINGVTKPFVGLLSFLWGLFGDIVMKMEKESDDKSAEKSAEKSADKKTGKEWRYQKDISRF